jgi:hypothetical protein
MENATIINLLNNSGLKVIGMDNNFVYIQDPSCIFPAFDAVFNFATTVALLFVAIMLFGWGLLYIKNGIKINTLFNNAKALILIFAIFGLTKPIVNFIYGDNLFARQCETKQISLTKVQELLSAREKKFGQYDNIENYEIFNIIDSGITVSSVQ